MDIPTLSYVYEGFDAGYISYVGFHIVRKTHTHPIALSFISLLLDLKKKKTKINSNKSESWYRAQSNWHMIYSIHNNEVLRLYRKHRIEQEKEHPRKPRHSPKAVASVKSIKSEKYSDKLKISAVNNTNV